MNRISDHRKKEYGGLRNPSATFNGHEVVVNNNGQSEAKKREIVVDWLNSMFTSLSLPKKALDEELRAYLINNPVLHHILNRMSPGSTNEVSDQGSSSLSHLENVKRFLAAMDVLGLPKFKMYDLEKGSMVPVINCLLTLRAQFASSNGKDTFSESLCNASSREFIYPSFKEERLKVLDPKLRNTFRGSLLSGPRFHDVFQLKQGCYADIPAARISEMMKSTSIDNAPTQSLLSVVNGILDESIEKKNGEIPHRVACLLRKVVQEIERRISTQAQHLKTQNNLFKAREEKYQSRIRVLEALATGTDEETQRAEKTTMEEKSRAEDVDVDIRWMKEKDRYNLEISSLKQELEMAKKTYELQCSKMESRVKDQYNLEISSLKQQLEIAGKTLELQRLQMEAQVRDQYSLEISSLQQELEISKKAYEMKRLQMEAHARNEYDLEVFSLKREAEVAKNKYEMKCSQIETQMKGHNDLKISPLEKELEEAKNNAEVKISQMDTQAYDHNDLQVSSLKQESEVERNDIVMKYSQMETRGMDHKDLEISSLKQESEVERNDIVMKYSQMETRGMDHKDLEISSLKQELEVAKKRYDTKCLEIETQAKDQHSREISSLKRELEEAKKNYKMKCLEFETQGKEGQYGHEISLMKQELVVEKHNDEIRRLEMETRVMDGDDPDILSLKLELEGAKKKYEMKCLEMEKQGTGQHSLEISSLKRELEESKKKYEMKCFETEAQSKDQYGPQISLLKQELEEVKKKYEMKCLETEAQAKDRYGLEISSLKQELEEAKKNYEMKCSELETLVGDRYGVEISSLKQDLEKAKKKYEMKYLEIEKQAKDQYNLEISSLKQELEAAKMKYEVKYSEIESQAKDQYNLEISYLKQELKAAKSNYEMKCLEIEKQTKDQYNLEISLLKQELETAKKNYEMQCSQVKTQAMGAEAELESKVEELQRSLQDSRNEVGDHKNKVSELERGLEDSIDKVRGHEQKVGELECNLEDSRNEVRDHKEKVIQLESNLKDSKNKVREQDEKMSKLERNLEDARNRTREMEADAAAILYASKTKECIYQGFMDSQYGALEELRSFGGAIKQEVLRSRSSYSEELNRIGPKLNALARAADDYHLILAENRKLFNEVQDLKGNIRVFCRVRPFLPKQTGRQTIIEHCGDDGELVIVNPSKQAKDGLRSFKFNKVFGPASTQAKVYSETQPFVRSVLDGFNACIFAYGQTGSGKTHTMSGPKGATKEEWGINFRALDDLFTISQNRRNSITYEIGVQMVEIYNEQVRDLLSADGSQKKIGIVTNSQSSGLAVPDATLKNVNSTSDVIVLMDTGLKNRTVSATAMNERSSRSHSIITIHVNGTDVKTGTVLRGSLHLVDLAGSERVDRSEVTGDRLKEAQHINKSLAALGDVIFALSQKSNHVPYRNSKLTQLLQTSLGGQAKTLMFVQVNPDSISYIETLSTLKFAERVSGVELGAARSSKDAKGDAKELIDQVPVASLKDTISKKDEEIEQLQVLKDLKNGYPSANVEKRVTRS